MIRPATELLRQNLGRSAFVVVVAAVAMIVPGAMLFCSGSASQLTHQWIEQFQPVVYLVPQIDRQGTDEVAGDVSGWEAVEAVDVRTPKDAWEQTRERLGEQELSNLGVEPSMFPFSLVVTPAADWGAGVDLIARLEALETRDTVEAVDVPSGRARRLLSWFRWGTILGGLLAVAGLAFAVYQIADYLRRLRRQERSELAVLERFGAEPSSIRRSTWIRGLVLGLWAGVLAFGVLLAVAVGWRGVIGELFGSMGIEGYWQWIAIGAPLLVGPLLGVLVGVWSARTGESSDRELPPELESLLEYS